MPKSLTTYADATAEQRRKALKVLIKSLLADKCYPREMLANYLASRLSTYLLGSLLSVLPMTGPLMNYRSKVNQMMQKLDNVPIDKVPELNTIFDEVWKSAPKSLKRLAGNIELPTGRNCAPGLLEIFQPPFITDNPKFPNGCSLAMSKAQLKQCFKQTSLKHPENPLINKFIPSITEQLLIYSKTRSDKTLDELCNIIAQLVPSGRVMSLNNVIFAFSSLFTGITQSVIWVLEGKLPSTILDKTLGPATLHIELEKRVKIITSSDFVDPLDDRHLIGLMQALKELEAQSIPWQPYINRAFAMTLPLLTMAMLFSSASSTNSSVMIGLVLPMFFTLLKQTIKHLYYLAFVRRQFAMYSNSAKYYLESAILLATENSGLLSVKQEHIVEDWQLVQLEIKLTQAGQKNALGHTRLFILTELLNEFNVEYTVVKPRQQANITAIYIAEAEVYDKLGLISYAFWRGCYHSQFAEQYRIKLIKQKFHQSVVSQILAPLRQQRRYIEAFFPEPNNAKALTYIIQESRHPELIQATLDKFQDLDLKLEQGKQHQFKISINLNEQAIKALEQLKANYMAKVDTKLAEQSKSTFPLPSDTQAASAAEAISAAPKLRRRKNRSQQSVEPGSMVNISAPHRWCSQRGHQYQDIDPNIYIMRATENYQHSIYMTHTLSRDNFHDPFVFARFITQLEIGRFASPRGQQGIFVTDGQQKMTVKVLGENGTGDIRLVANGFLDDNGCHLYIINRVEDHAGKLLNSPIQV